MHGVGVSVVNALSEWLELKIKRDKSEYYIKFKNGVPVEPLKKVGSADSSGTSITFMPSKNTFTKTNFGPTANGIIGGPYYGPNAGHYAWYGSIANTNNGKGYYAAYFAGSQQHKWAGGASTTYWIRWREGYIHMNYGQHYGPVYYKEADIHNYLDEMAVFYGIL